MGTGDDRAKYAGDPSNLWDPDTRNSSGDLNHL